ncbi:MTMR3 [Acrasis kona]|uniref:MTMR3 n=1 Tax=Acrasis kona TaxID=1008807 RepID=A0AAW2Z5X6_9EUKA
MQETRMNRRRSMSMNNMLELQKHIDEEGTSNISHQINGKRARIYSFKKKKKLNENQEEELQRLKAELQELTNRKMEQYQHAREHYRGDSLVLE